MACLNWALGIIVKRLIELGLMKVEKAVERAKHEAEIDKNAERVAEGMKNAKTQAELDQADRDLLGH